MEASLAEPRLLVQPHSEELLQAAALLTAALQEGETFTCTAHLSKHIFISTVFSTYSTPYNTCKNPKQLLKSFCKTP